MTALAGEVYYGLSKRHQVPAGLVSDPANYSRCVAQLEASAERSTPESVRQGFLAKCRQIHEAVKAQAVSFLVNAKRAIAIDGREGATASEGDLHSMLVRYKQRYGYNDAQLAGFLAARRWTLADELFQMRLDVIATKALSNLQSGGKAALAKRSEAERKLTRETLCAPGYVVAFCNGHEQDPNSASHLPSSVLMEQVAALVTGRCTNTEACGQE